MNVLSDFDKGGDESHMSQSTNQNQITMNRFTSVGILIKNGVPFQSGIIGGIYRLVHRG